MPSRYHWQSQRSCKCRNSCIFLDNITKSYWPLWFSPCVLDTFQFSAYQYFICACVQSHAHIPYKLCINYLSECLKKKFFVCAKRPTHGIIFKQKMAGTVSMDDTPLIFCLYQGDIKTPMDYSISLTTVFRDISYWQVPASWGLVKLLCLLCLSSNNDEDGHSWGEVMDTPDTFQKYPLIWYLFPFVQRWSSKIRHVLQQVSLKSLEQTP